MRLFVAVVPPEHVLDQIGELAAALRDEAGGSEERDRRGRVRWTTRAQWHVTLRFLGEVADPAVVVEALKSEGDPCLGDVEAELDPEPTILGRSVLCLPVHGLDELARAVSEATAHIGQPPEPRRFRGHVTIARLRGRRAQGQGFGNATRPRWGRPAAVRWTVSEVHLLRSHLHPDGSRYEVLSTMPLS